MVAVYVQPNFVVVGADVGPGLPGEDGDWGMGIGEWRMEIGDWGLLEGEVAEGGELEGGGGVGGAKQEAVADVALAGLKNGR